MAVHGGGPLRTGQCLCGAVRITTQGEPIGVRVCWCRVCQYLAAGGATVNAIFAKADVQVDGALCDYVSIADSGNVMHRRFCPSCGTPLFSASEARPDRLIVRVGAMDNRGDFRPDATIWTKSAPAWACLDETVPRSPAQPAAIK